MSKSLGKYAGEQDWLNAVWHIRMERLSIANLLGNRPLERGELAFLENWPKQLNSEDKRLQLLESQLRYLLDTGEISAAEGKADQLVDHVKGAGERPSLRKAYGWRAVVYREQSQYQKAIADFEVSESCAENDLQRMEIWLDKGMTLVYANRYQEAEKMLQGAINIAQKYNDINNQGTAYNNLGICYGQQRKGQPAIDAYAKALSFYQQTGYKLGSAMACGNLSEIYLSRGQLDRALELAGQCQKLGAEAEDIISIALGQDIAGRTLTELGDHAAAAELYKKCFKVFCEVNDAESRIMSGFHLTICLARSGNIAEAEEFFRQLETMGFENGNQPTNYYPTMARATILMAGEQYGPARELLEKCLIQAPSNEQKLGEILLQLAEIYDRQRESELIKGMLERLQTIPEDNLTNLFRVKMYSVAGRMFSRIGLKTEGEMMKNKGLALLSEMKGYYTDSDIWERYCRKKEVREILERTGKE